MNLHTYLMIKNAQLTYSNVLKKYKGRELTDSIQRSWYNFASRNYRSGMDGNQFVRNFINQYGMPADMPRKQQIRRLWRAMDSTPSKHINSVDRLAKKVPGKWLNYSKVREDIRALNGELRRTAHLTVPLDELKRTAHLTSIPGLP